MSVLREPREPGMVAYEVEVVPHFAMSNGQGWEKGTGSAAHVARTLRHYADMVEQWSADRCEVAFEGYYDETDGAA